MCLNLVSIISSGCVSNFLTQREPSYKKELQELLHQLGSGSRNNYDSCYDSWFVLHKNLLSTERASVCHGVRVCERERVCVCVCSNPKINRTLYNCNKGHSVWFVCVRSTNHSYFVNQLPSRPPKPLIEAGSTINLQTFKMPCPSLPEVSRTGGSGGLQQFTGRLYNTLCLRHFAKSEIMSY